MKVHIKGGLKQSKTPHGSPFYVIVRDDIKNPDTEVQNREVFMYVNEYRMAQPLIRTGDLKDVCPNGCGTTPWKCYDSNSRVVNYRRYAQKFNIF